VARTRLIVGLITPHRIYLTIMKPVREAKARSRAMLCMYVSRLPHLNFGWIATDDEKTESLLQNALERVFLSFITRWYMQLPFVIP
jgi:hypothetical protein